MNDQILTKLHMYLYKYTIDYTYVRSNFVEVGYQDNNFIDDMGSVFFTIELIVASLVVVFILYWFPYVWSIWLYKYIRK